MTAVPKVIDFGVAKATHGSLTERTLYTGFAQMIGTPLYMSPEQAQLNSLDVDTRSDVYSLGVLLYELLTGATPFDGETLKRVGFDEMRRMIREDEPPRPSHRISTLENKQASTVSNRRRTDTRQLSLAMRRELDWIVMKALEKDRTRRYESASALALDVQRYLDGEAVLACPPTAVYRLKKLARRRKALLTTCLFVGVTALAGTAVSVWQAVEATAARDRAEKGFRQSLEAVDRMLARVADKRLEFIPSAQPVRKELFNDAIQFYETFLVEHPGDAQVRLEVARAWHGLSKLQASLGESDAALKSSRHAIRFLEELRGENPDDIAVFESLSAAYGALTEVEFYHRFECASAEKACLQYLQLSRELADRRPSDRERPIHAAAIETHLGEIYGALGRNAEAEQMMRSSIEKLRKRVVPSDLR